MFKMENNTYDFWKKVCERYLPALIVLWSALAKIWGFPYAVEIAGTLAAINTFLGVVLGISSANYYKALDNVDGEKD